jgi:hypothetical protein
MRTSVLADHETVRLVLLLRKPVGVKLYEPKLTPHNVTDAPPDVAALYKLTRVTTGASYVKLCELVPSMDVTCTKADSNEPDPLAHWKYTVVSDTQLSVPGLVPPIVSVGDESTIAKFRPMSVTEDGLPLVGALRA